MKTHKVLDLHYLPDEGQECFDGTLQECEEWAATQTPHFMYKVVPMTLEEIRNHPDNNTLNLLRKFITMKNIQEFIEQHYPNYSSAQEIATLNDLELLINDEEELTESAERLLENEYEGNQDSIYIYHDYYKLLSEIYAKALEISLNLIP